MVPSGTASRQVLIWSVPTLVILLSLVWYRRKRNTLRTDPGGTSDSATKAKASTKADKQTNGFVHPGEDALPEDLVQPAVPNKEPVKSVVQEAVPEKKSVVQEAVPEKKSVVKEAVPEKKSVVQEAVPEEKSVVTEAVPEEKSVVQEAVPEKKSVVQEAVPEKKSVVQEAVPEKKSVVQEALPEEVKKQEPVPKPSVVQAVPEVEQQVKKPVVKEEKKPSVVQEEKTVKKAVPKEVEEQVVAKKVAKEEKKPSVVQGEKKVKKAVPKEVEEQVVVKKIAKAQGAVPKVEEALVVKKSQESVPVEKPRKKEMSEEEVVSEGAAAVDAAAGLQEEKVGSLGGKLASLTLEEQRADADRDSANHSPVDAMLASPSLSNYSDEHSEGSSDSGKGCSDVASPPSRTPLGGSSLAGDAENDADVRDADVRYTVYEFLLPHNLVGRLIGPRGSFVQDIKSKTNATVQVKKHPELNRQKICVVDGTQSEVDAALAMIRERYPIRKFPVVTLEQVSIYSNAQPQPTCALIPEYCQLHLVEGVNNEVMVSCMVSPGHMFLQQPYHPTFQYLTRLSEAMNSVYSHADAPHVPEPITVGSICVAPATEGWYRVQVVSVDDESRSCEVKFVDHGGYMTISNSSLRQIHHDFMSVPFQATECFLANIKPPGGSNLWSDEAVRLVDELTRGQMLYAQVYDYTEYSIPLVYLYCCINSLVVLVNQELVARGLAELDDVASTEPVSAQAAALVAAAAEVAPLTRPATETPSEVDAV